MVKYWVTMNDTFMSYPKKLVFVCNSYDDAKIVERNAKDRKEMKYVKISSTKPSFPKAFKVEYKYKANSGRWFEKDRPWEEKKK